jgi:hypothetical protein
MPGILQRSFAGGEVGNELLPRQDTVKVQSGAKTMLNWWAMRSGGAQTRPGFSYVQECKDAHDDIRIERFHFTDDQAYAIEVGAAYMRFYQFAEESAGLLVDGDDGSNPMETQTLYLSDTDDDVAALSGTLPSSTVTDSDGIQEKSLIAAQGSSSTKTATAASGSRLSSNCFTSLSGNPGAVASWDAASQTLVIDITSISGVAGGSAAATLLPRLHRTNASGVGQERTQSGGVADGDPTSVTIPGGGPGVLGPFGVDILSGGTGQYTFTWASTSWGNAGDAIADGDRITVELLISTVSTSSRFITYTVEAAPTQFDTSVAPQSTPDAIPWTSGTAFQVGEVTSIMSFDQYRRVFYLDDTAPDTAPTSITSEGDEAHGTLIEKDDSRVSPIPAADDPIAMSFLNGVTEVQAFITEAGDVDGWTWPTDDVTVSLVFSNQGGAGSVLDVSVALARLNASNAVQVEGTFTATQDVFATGPFSFTVTPPSWSTPASDDRFAILVKYTSTGDVTMDIETRNASSYVDVPAIATGDGTKDYFYCTADHTGKSPEYEQYHDDFWYPLTGTNDAGNVLLEVPTPFAQAHLGDLDFNQSGAVMTITHRSYPPHELVRYAHSQMSFGRWTCLPIAFKPRHTHPTGVTDGGATGDATGERDIRYKVTAISADTDAESNPGANTTTSADNLVTNAESTTLDLSVADTGHGLITGDEIIITEVETQDDERAHQNAVEQLEGAVFIVDRVDLDNFTLRNTAGILTLPSISDADSDAGYPEIQVTWAKAYIEFSGVKIPKGEGAKLINLSWDEVPGTREYWIYRQIRSDGTASGTTETDAAIQDWGFLGASKGTTFQDAGGEEDNTPAVVDDENPPPEYINPFIYGFWPRASAYHQQRQWFGGSDNEPMRLWASKIGDFRNFSRHFPIADSDRGQWDIDTLDASEINGIRALGQVLVFTSGGIATLKGNSEGVVTPSQPNIEWLASEGAAIIRPEAVDDVLLYVQARGGRVREVRFDVGAGGFAGYGGRDLTVFSPHLFYGFQIKDLSRASVPESIMWCVRDDGVMLGLTFLREQDIWAWHRHSTLNGEFQSVATVPEENEDVVYAVVKRTLSAGTKYYVERMKPRKVGRSGTDDRLTSFFMDSGVTVDGTNTGAVTLTLSGGVSWEAAETGLTLTASEALFLGTSADVGTGYRLVGSDGLEVEVEITLESSTTVATVKLLTDAPASTRSPTALSAWVAMVRTISGLDHLEGDAVYALADSNVLGPFTVSSGAITLSTVRPYGIIHAGLRITADLELLDVDLVSDRNTDVDVQKRVPRVTAFLEETRRLKVGTDTDRLSLLDESDTGEAQSLSSDKVTQLIKTGFNKSGRVVFRQEDGLPSTVTAVVRHLQDSPGGTSV